MAAMKLLPRPKHLKRDGGTCRLPETITMRLSPAAAPLEAIIAREWSAEFPGRVAPAFAADDSAGYTFTTGPAAPPPPATAESFALAITPDGIAAAAADYRELLYAWQCLKRYLRSAADRSAIR
jgi:hypothetical protein